ncbi:predicted protein [Nematostella vectensis]|uniref:BTB domain-containing protein n=1 Tax=Nematostella vectensis TaxID=45351 RepID=A7T1W2_NEMVE|nr:BTB and MATH domain-containing protein 36 [Nematostella vectensis]EDO30051.1 predicted protein [Nematostella vectensis]|eukprot:XP_001622151.1 hypothetical protein NEMVEDRAFT_v1g248552 [Nematostella vectensis]
MQKKGSEPDFSVPWHLSDAVLVVEEKHFNVHKSTLSMWSPVFEKMFRERNDQEICLPGKKSKEIKEMLLVIYPTSKKVTEENCYYLLTLAQEYQMEQLTERCEKYLIQREKTPFQAIDFLVLAHGFKMSELCKQCIEIAKHISLNELRKHEKYSLVEDGNGKQLAERRVELLEGKVATLEQKPNSIRKEIKETCEWAIREISRVVFHKKHQGDGKHSPRALGDCLRVLEEEALQSPEMNLVVQLLQQRLRKIYEPQQRM